MKKIIAVVGPTASGKTSLSIKIAQQYNGAVISADSRQLYKDLDIGTAKIKGLLISGYPEPIIRYEGIDHYMLDVIDPDETYAVPEFKKRATSIIDGLHDKGVLPLIVGGTMLYTQALLDNYSIPKVPPNQEYRNQLESQIEERGLQSLVSFLYEQDPVLEGVIDAENPRRVIRALEVIHSTGKPFSEQGGKGEPLYDQLILAPDVSRETLRENMHIRVMQMLDQGLEAEARSLFEKWGRGSILSQTIGYQEFIPYFDKKVSLDDVAKKIEVNTWQYAKRQLTWFKKDERVHWVNDVSTALELVDNFLDN